jgi:hypothetical protein
MAVYAIMKTYTQRIAPLLSNLEMVQSDISERRLQDIGRLYDSKVWNINWQAGDLLVSTALGGACSIGSAFAKSNGMDELFRLLKTGGQVIPKGGEIANTFLRANDVALDSQITTLSQHRMPEVDRIKKNASDQEQQINKTVGQLIQEENALYHLKS